MRQLNYPVTNSAPEFISPEVMRCTTASTASDMWSIGVIIFMMVTGGYSPFYSRNKYKMQRRTLRGNYDIEQFQVKILKISFELKLD